MKVYPKRRFHRIELYLLPLLFLMVTVFYLLGHLERFELILLDARYQWSPTKPDPAIAIVAIDNSSLKELAQWPWPRSYHGVLVERLAAAGVKAIGFDLDFSTPRSLGDDRIFAQSVRKAGNVVLGAFHEDRTVGGLKIQYSSLPFLELREASAGVGTLSFPVDLDGGVRRGFVALLVGRGRLENECRKPRGVILLPGDWRGKLDWKF